jgi:hypothetical protein
METQTSGGLIVACPVCATLNRVPGDKLDAGGTCGWLLTRVRRAARIGKPTSARVWATIPSTTIRRRLSPRTSPRHLRVRARI